MLLRVLCLISLTIPALSSFLGTPEPGDPASIMPQEETQKAETQVEGQAQPPGDQDQDDDNAPMVHHTPVDYRSWALEQRPVLQAEGEEVVLMSELSSHIPRRPDETDVDFTKRYVQTMNDMISRGVQILNDHCKGDVAPDLFSLSGMDFDVGPKSGITKKEYREFSEWIGSDEANEAASIEDVPERFRKFETKNAESDT